MAMKKKKDSEVVIDKVLVKTVELMSFKAAGRAVQLVREAGAIFV